MLKLFKNFLSLKRFSKTAIISIVLFSIILGLVLPISASAQFEPIPPGWKTLINAMGSALIAILKPVETAATWIATGMIAATASILILITTGFLVLCESLLNWVISPGFISVSFTGPDNPVVDAGWRIIRDFTNILIVLGLVIIALATILRISTYHAKKTLPLLLIVALLVNFSPVICGVIIDASNIVMNYFLEGGGLSKGFIITLTTQINNLLTSAGSPEEMLGKGIVFIGFNIIGGFIFLLLALLFLFRYIALWILVVLSPLAFFCYVFPFTKKYWTMWWNQFFQWCIIGIPAAFSIFLANQIITRITPGSPGLIGAPTGELSGFADIVIYTVPLALLAGGIVMALQTGAVGANIITGAFQKYVVGGGRRVAGWAGRKGWQTAKEATRGARRRAGGALRKIKTGKEGKELDEGKGHGAKQAGRWAAGWALRPLGRILERGATEETTREIKESEEKLKGKTEEAIATAIEIGGMETGVGGLLGAIRSKKLRKIRDRGLINDEKLKRLARATLLERPELFEDIRDVLPRMAGEIGEEMEGEIERFKRMGKYKAAGRLGSAMKRAGIDLTPEDRIKYGTLTEKIRATAKPSKMDLWSKGEMQEAIRSRRFHKNMTPGQLSQLAKTFEGDFFTTWKEEKGGKKWYGEDNPPVEKYISSSAGQGLGITFAEDEEKKPGRPPGEERREEKREEKKPPPGRPGVGGARRKPIIDMEKDKQTGSWRMKKRRKKDTGE